MKGRGPVQRMASVLLALRGGPLHQSQFRRAAGLRGSTICRHLKPLLRQQLVTTWTEPYNPAVDHRRYELTEEGREAVRHIQLNFDIHETQGEDHR